MHFPIHTKKLRKRFKISLCLRAFLKGFRFGGQKHPSHLDKTDQKGEKNYYFRKIALKDSRLNKNISMLLLVKHIYVALAENNCCIWPLVTIFQNSVANFTHTVLCKSLKHM